MIKKLLGDVIALNFTVYGGNTSVGEVAHNRFPIRVIFNHTPLPGGRNQCRTFFFLSKTSGPLNYFKIPFILVILKHFLGGDVKMLNSIKFWPRLTEEDIALKMFIDLVNELGAFDPH